LASLQQLSQAKIIDAGIIRDADQISKSMEKVSRVNAVKAYSAICNSGYFGPDSFKASIRNCGIPNETKKDITI
jgi:hypothetical protein